MASDTSAARLLMTIGHDMRQPLHALLLYLDALERRVKDVETRDILRKADRAAQSLAEMIEGLIQLTRLNANKVEPECERVALQNLFTSILLAAPHAEADNTAFYVHSDPILLETILRHLVNNAGTHGGGSAHLSATDNNGAVEIQVRDSGPGIPLKDQDRIFAEFVRLGERHDGLGVGLTIARKLATLMDHKIEVRSTPGHGATFIVHAARA